MRGHERNVSIFSEWSPSILRVVSLQAEGIALKSSMHYIQMCSEVQSYFLDTYTPMQDPVYFDVRVPPSVYRYPS